MRVRRLESSSDVETVASFLTELEVASGVPPLGESKFVDLGGPRRGRGFMVEEGERLVAYLHLLWHESSGVWEMELAADGDEVDASTLAAAVQSAADEAGGPLLWWTFGEGGGAGFADGRFPLARELHKLAGALPPSEPSRVPTGVQIRPFRPGVDEDAWLVANNAAFAGHPENGEWGRRHILERESRDWFEAEGFRLAWAGDRVAGFCWTKRHTPALGEIHVIGVHPDFQGRGLGRSIVIEGLWYLAGVGASSAMLYVDTTNRSALELYQSLGFALERVDRCFEIPKGWSHDVQ